MSTIFKMEKTHHTLSVFADSASSANEVAKTSADKPNDTIFCLDDRCDNLRSIVLSQSDPCSGRHEGQKSRKD